MRGHRNQHLIRSILEYILDYPTHVHHPVEDLVYGELKIRNPAISPDSRRIEQEHADLEKQTRQFAVAVDRALQGEELPLQELVQMGQDLIDRLQRHMRAEETTLFPAARSSLMSTDWANIALVLGAPTIRCSARVSGISTGASSRRSWPRKPLDPIRREETAAISVETVPPLLGNLTPTLVHQNPQIRSDAWTKRP